MAKWVALVGGSQITMSIDLQNGKVGILLYKRPHRSDGQGVFATDDDRKLVFVHELAYGFVERLKRSGCLTNDRIDVYVSMCMNADSVRLDPQLVVKELNLLASGKNCCWSFLGALSVADGCF